MVCRNFDREKFKLHDWEVKLQRAYDELTNCEDEAKLVAGLKEAINQGIKERKGIDELLEYVGRMRAIGIQSRKVTKPQAFTWKSDAEQKEETTETTSKEEKALSRYPNHQVGAPRNHCKGSNVRAWAKASDLLEEDVQIGYPGRPLVQPPRRMQLHLTMQA
eukprot:g15184.t1